MLPIYISIVHNSSAAVIVSMTLNKILHNYTTICIILLIIKHNDTTNVRNKC